MDNRATVQQQLKTFFSTEILEGQDQGLDASTPLLDHGLLDSMTIMKLVAFMRENYAISVPARDLTPDNLKNLTTLSDLVVRMQANVR